jgi:hypothetical protein
MKNLCIKFKAVETEGGNFMTGMAINTPNTAPCWAGNVRSAGFNFEQGKLVRSLRGEIG